MKTPLFAAISLGVISTLAAQSPAVVPPPPPPPIPAPAGTSNPAPSPDAQAQPPAASDINAVTREGEDEKEVPKGSFLKAKKLNDWFTILAGKAGYSYYDNRALADMTVQGRNLGDNPLAQMKEICIMYGLTLYTKGDTVYALTNEQVSALPKKDYVYQLQYLRGTSTADAKNLTELIKPSLSGGGSVFYEPKTYTLVIRDNDYAIENIRKMLEVLDRPKGQVIVTIRILRLNGEVSKGVGVDWSKTLGSEPGQGLTIGATAYGSAGQIFNTAPVFGEAVAALQSITGAQNTGTTQGTTGAGGTTPTDAGSSTSTSPTVTGDGVVLSPITVEVVLRALIQNNYATSERNPRLVTEDNEEIEFGVEEKIPIIESTVNESVGGGNPTVATTVRYKIDPDEDPNAPLKTKLGFTIKVRPTILPDGTIRLETNPQIGVRTGSEEAATGVPGVVNSYPIVNIAGYRNQQRIPNGYTLVATGYYTIEDQRSENKVPLLGDLPMAGSAFRSKITRRVRSNLVFLITARTYDAASQIQTVEEKERLMQSNFDSASVQVPDPQNPQDSAKPNLGNALRGLWPFGKKKTEAPVNPLDEEHPDRLNQPRMVTSQEVQEGQIKSTIIRRAQPVDSE